MTVRCEIAASRPEHEGHMAHGIWSIAGSRRQELIACRPPVLVFPADHRPSAIGHTLFSGGVLATYPQKGENGHMSPLALKEILKLSVSERVQLAEDIWDSIVASPESLPVTDAQKRELDLRRDTHASQ